MRPGPRDTRLIDALDGREGVALDEVVWRVASDGRDPADCFASGGRWDDGTFDVLYTSFARAGALTEMRFHVSRGQPVIPTKREYRLHEVRVILENALDLSSMDDLAALGLNPQTFGQLSYADKGGEYPRTQEIGEVAHFHGFDGLIVPSARSAANNLVVFCDEVAPEGMEPIRDHGVIDWSDETDG